MKLYSLLNLPPIYITTIYTNLYINIYFSPKYYPVAVHVLFSQYKYAINDTHSLLLDINRNNFKHYIQRFTKFVRILFYHKHRLL